MSTEEVIQQLDKIKGELINHFGGWPYSEDENTLLRAIDEARNSVKISKIVNNNLHNIIDDKFNPNNIYLGMPYEDYKEIVKLEGEE